MSESLHGMRQYTVRRHPKGAITLHRHDDQFLLVARAEGGGISTFWRLYSEPALTGMTPGKGASSYIGKVEGDGLYLRRGKKSPKACSLEFRYGKKALPDGTRQLAVLCASLSPVLAPFPSCRRRRHCCCWPCFSCCLCLALLI
eukprot:COSAG04_NODE_734_length_10713_cov_2.619748_5_plen_144_part_00